MLAVSKATGRDCECLPRIATALGGGVAGQGEVCGALMGGILGIGLVYGRDRAEDTDAKAVAGARGREFYQKFQEANKSVLCRAISGVDLRTSEGRQAFSDQNLHGNTCSGVVGSAVRLFLTLYEAGEGGQA